MQHNRGGGIRNLIVEKEIKVLRFLISPKTEKKKKNAGNFFLGGLIVCLFRQEEDYLERKDK